MRFMRDYDRQAAVLYAHQWAYGRNPAYYDYENLGGDCTNFASQCIYAGTGIMNFTPTFGWYYVDANQKAPAWTGVKYLFNFLTTNSGVGPYGRQVEISEVMPGDLCQLIIDEEDWQHTPVITAIDGDHPSFETVRVAAHSYDCNCRPLSSYKISAARFIHIDGIRSMQPLEVPEEQEQ